MPLKSTHLFTAVDLARKNAPIQLTSLAIFQVDNQGYQILDTAQRRKGHDLTGPSHRAISPPAILERLFQNLACITVSDRLMTSRQPFSFRTKIKSSDIDWPSFRSLTPVIRGTKLLFIFFRHCPDHFCDFLSCRCGCHDLGFCSERKHTRNDLQFMRGCDFQFDAPTF